MALFVVYGFDTAGTFGEETLDASRQAPRGVLSRSGSRASSGAIFLLAVTLSFKDIAAAVAKGQAFGFPIADTIKDNLTFAFPGGFTMGDLYLVVILIAVYVCTLAIQGATVRLMFSMGRDRRLPFGGLWGHVHPTFQTPANAAVAVGVLGRDPALRDRRPVASIPRHRGDGHDLPQLLPVQPRRPQARRKGWPHKGAWFNLGSWGTIINVVALIWGGLMIVNIGLWTRPRSSATSGTTCGTRGRTRSSTRSSPSARTRTERRTSSPACRRSRSSRHWSGSCSSSEPSTTSATGQSGRVDKVEADLATGEAVLA